MICSFSYSKIKTLLLQLWDKTSPIRISTSSSELSAASRLLGSTATESWISYSFLSPIRSTITLGASCNVTSCTSQLWPSSKKVFRWGHLPRSLKEGAKLSKPSTRPSSKALHSTSRTWERSSSPTKVEPVVFTQELESSMESNRHLFWPAPRACSTSSPPRRGLEVCKVPLSREVLRSRRVLWCRDELQLEARMEVTARPLKEAADLDLLWAPTSWNRTSGL